MPEPRRSHRISATRAGYATLGIGFVGIGFVGLFIPGLPTTIFCILALFCFKRSSSRLEKWLLNHRLLGPTLRDWEENRWITARAKAIAIISIAVFSMFGCFMIRQPDPAIAWTIRGAILAFAAYGAWFVSTRKTKPAESIAKSPDSAAA